MNISVSAVIGSGSPGLHEDHSDCSIGIAGAGTECQRTISCRNVIYSRLLAHDPASREGADYVYGAGINVEHLPYVEVIKATAVKVQPLGEESHWNVDGELMPHNEVAAHVCQGAVQVFSRGIEVEHSVCA